MVWRQRGRACLVYMQVRVKETCYTAQTVCIGPQGFKRAVQLRYEPRQPLGPCGFVHWLLSQVYAGAVPASSGRSLHAAHCSLHSLTENQLILLMRGELVCIIDEPSACKCCCGTLWGHLDLHWSGSTFRVAYNAWRRKRRRHSTSSSLASHPGRFRCLLPRSQHISFHRVSRGYSTVWCSRVFQHDGV